MDIDKEVIVEQLAERRYNRNPAKNVGWDDHRKWIEFISWYDVDDQTRTEYLVEANIDLEWILQMIEGFNE